MIGRTFVLLGLGMSLATALPAQFPPGRQGSSNVHILSHVPLGRLFTVGDVEIEQEMSRPYAYVPRMHGITSSTGFSIIDLGDPTRAKEFYSWRIENADLHRGFGGLDGKYFKIGGRYFYAQSLQLQQGSPNAEVGAVVFDVTGLPDTTTIREVGRIRAPDAPGGFHNVFAYKHSDGRALLFATASGQARANIYDLGRFLAGDGTFGLIGYVPVPENPAARDEAITISTSRTIRRRG